MTGRGAAEDLLLIGILVGVVTIVSVLVGFGGGWKWTPRVFLAGLVVVAVQLALISGIHTVTEVFVR